MQVAEVEPMRTYNIREHLDMLRNNNSSLIVMSLSWCWRQGRCKAVGQSAFQSFSTWR